MYRILELNPQLYDFSGDIDLRMSVYESTKKRLLQDGQSLSDFANGHQYYGFHHVDGGWYYREWAPSAEQLYLEGEFNGWNKISHPFPREGNGWSFHYCRRQWSLKDNGFLKYQWLNDFDQDMIHLCKKHKIFAQKMANLQLMKAPEQMLCFARCDLFFVFNFHASNSLEHILIPVHPDTKELVVEMSSDDENYGGFSQVQHMTYPAKEFDGVRYVEIYIPARTAIVLREVKRIA